MRNGMAWAVAGAALVLWGCGGGGNGGEDPGGPAPDAMTQDTNGTDPGPIDPGEGDTNGGDPGTPDTVREDGSTDPDAADDGAPADATDDSGGSGECPLDGDTRAVGCGGLNGRATLAQTCLQGHWTDTGTCIDPDLCVDNATRVVPCQDGSGGDQTQECRLGRWAWLDDCGPAALCEDGATRMVPCGLNGNGDQGQKCVGASWVDDGTCDDPDECLDDDEDTVRCGVNEVGRLTRTCIDGRWASTGCVADFDARVTWPKDIRTLGHRPRIYGMAAAGDRILLNVQANWSHDELLVMDHPDGPARVLEPRVVVHGLGAQPTSFKGLGDRVFFFRDDGIHGEEPWISDGTGSGTRMLADITPGRQGVGRSLLDPGPDPADRRIFFLANYDGSNALRVYEDDTATPRNLGAFVGIGEAVRLGDVVLFNGDTTVEGPNLWRTDGTPEGTVLLKDFVPKSADGTGPTNMVVYRGLAYFQAEVAGGGAGMWRTDGTVAGTRRMADDMPGTPIGGAPSNLAVIADRLHYSADAPSGAVGEVWRTDGTAEGTIQMTQIGGNVWAADFHHVGNALLFTVRTADGGREWWRLPLEGPNPQATRVKALTPAAGGSGIYSVTPYDDKVYFTYKDATDTQRLYVTDGTAAGTGAVGDQDWMLDGAVEQIYAAGDHLYVTKRVSSEEDRLYRVVPGGEAVEIQLPRERSSLLGESAAVLGNDRLAFLARTDENGLQPWISDGTSDGTTMLPGVTQRTEWLGRPMGVTRFGNSAVFRAFQTDTGREPWITGGTMQTTRLLRDCNPGATSSNPGRFHAFGSRLYFLANDAGGAEPWFSDGTTGGTVRLVDLEPGSGYSNPSEFAGIPPKTPGAPWTVLFSATTSATGQEPWVHDGTNVSLLKNIATGNAGSSPRYMTTAGAHVCFSATDQEAGREPWCSDGTTDGTQRLGDIVPGRSGSQPDWLVGYTSKDGMSRLLFVATDEAGDREPWQSIGPGQAPTVLADLMRRASSNPSHLHVTGRMLLMSALMQGAGRELVMIDLEQGSVTPVDIRARGAGSEPMDFFSWDDRFTFFSADDGVNGRELWVTDGTAAGTRMVADLNPGASGSYPWVLGRGGNLLYVQAWTAAQGNELLVLDLSAR